MNGNAVMWKESIFQGNYEKLWKSVASIFWHHNWNLIRGLAGESHHRLGSSRMTVSITPRLLLLKLENFYQGVKKYSYISIECVIEMFPLPTKSSLFETRLDEDNNFILFLRLLLLSFPPPTHLPITPMSMANKVYWAVLMRCVSRWTNQFVQSIMSDRREAAAVRPNHCFRAISPHYSAPNRALLYISSESSLALRLYHQWLSRQPTTLLPVWLFNVSLRSSCTTSASNIFCICSTSIHGLHLYSAFFSALVISAGDQATVWSRWQTDLSASPPISNWPPHSPSSPLPSI